MSTRDEQRVGDLIRRYREDQNLSQEALAGKLGVDASYVSLLERGKRRIDASLARKIDEALPFSPEDRRFFWEHTPLVEFLDPVRDFLVEQEVDRTFSRFRLRPAVSSLLSLADYFPQWASARIAHLRCNMKRAIPQLQAVVRKAENDHTEQSRGKMEFFGMILLDMADAYGLAGEIERAKIEAERAWLVCRDLLNTQLRNEQTMRRLHMGMARSIVLLQEIAYEQGDEDLYTSLDIDLKNHFVASGDHYGWAKRSYFLALFRFHQGSMAEAKRLAWEALDHARMIKLELDPWWIIRDGIFLGEHWWRLHCLSLMIDILCFENRLRDHKNIIDEHREARSMAFWARDLPPFRPKYWWRGNDNAGNDVDIVRIFSRWVNDEQRLNAVLYLPETLVSWGDYLSSGESTGRRDIAAEKYHEALDFAEQRGFGLMKRVASERLSRL